MKDIIIKGSVLKKEIIIFSICFILANLLNIYAIASRHTRWIELLTMLHIVLAFTFILYGIYFLFRKLFRLFFK